MIPRLHGRWLSHRRILGTVLAGALLLGCLGFLAIRSTQQQTNAPMLDVKPAEATTEKPPQDLVDAAKRPYVLNDIEQPRLPKMVNHTEELKDLRAQMQEMRNQHAKELAQLREELSRKSEVKATATKTPDPNAQRLEQEAREAAKQQAERRKAARTSAMGMLRDDQEDATKTGKIIPPLAKHVVSAGSIIGCSLESGINTEHPGPVIARVTTPVYDSVTGIPLEQFRDATLIGQYRAVLLGEETLHITWDKMVFRDKSEIALEGQPGGDQTGQAGLTGEVDNKWGTQIFALFVGSVQRASMAATSMMAETDAQRIAGMTAQGVVQDGGQRMMRTMNVNPVIHKAPGALCSLIVMSSFDATALVR